MEESLKVEEEIMREKARKEYLTRVRRIIELITSPAIHY